MGLCVLGNSTWELVEQQLHRAHVEIQLVHVVLAEVADLQVPEKGHNRLQTLALIHTRTRVYYGLLLRDIQTASCMNSHSYSHRAKAS